MAQLEAQTQSQTLEPSVDHVDKTKSLICALNLVSRNLPLPPDLYDAVSSIYLSPEENDNDADLNDDAVNAAAGSVAHKVLVWFSWGCTSLLYVFALFVVLDFCVIWGG